MIDEQHAVQMINFMLDTGCHDAVGLDFPNFIVAIQIAHTDPVGALDLGEMIRQRQTAFFMNAVVIRNFDDLRIGQCHRLRVFVLTRHVDDDDAAAVTNLRRGQTDTVGCIHGFKHVIHQLAHIFVDGVDRLRLDFQARVRGDNDRHYGHQVFRIQYILAWKYDLGIGSSRNDTSAGKKIGGREIMWQGLIGIVAFPLIAWGLSENRHGIRFRSVATGLVIQIALAALLLGFPPVKQAFLALNSIVTALMDATRAGTSFVFGYIGGDTLPFAATGAGSTFNLAFQALPLILVVSALSALLFHWRVLPKIVEAAALLLGRSFNIGGALGIGVAANIFISMVESPLLVRPYLKNMTRGELFVLMTAGMATVAGTVLVLYASIVSPVIPGALGHILTASILSAPAAITIAQLMVPLSAPTPGKIDIADDGNAMAAITRGTMEGVSLLINVVALLIVAVALVALVNGGLGLLPDIADAPVTLQRLLGWAMAPIAFAMGIPWTEAVSAGALLGVKTVLNELLAYLQLAGLDDSAMSERSRLIMTYALCGFANFGSLGIMIGGLITMCPERRDEIIQLSGRTIISGTLATCLTGAVAGLFF